MIENGCSLLCSDEERNVAYSSTVIVDRDGKLRWSQPGDRLMTRSGAEVCRVVELIGRLRAAGKFPMTSAQY